MSSDSEEEEKNEDNPYSSKVSSAIPQVITTFNAEATEYLEMRHKIKNAG